MPKIQNPLFDFILKNPIVNSSRRILKSYSSNGLDGRYDPIYLSDHASGTLIRFNYKYFLLTARHCIQKFRDENGNEIPLSDFQNMSPFWINKSDAFEKTNNIMDFFYVRKIWLIGESFKNQNLDGVDLEDVCLLELYYPFTPVKNYINLNDLSKIATRPKDLKNSIMGFSGYPSEKNPYFYEQNTIAPIYGDATHSTAFCRWYDFGRNEDLKNMITLFNNRSFEYSGMCGGTVFSINLKDNDFKWAGMYISGSANKARYLPSYILLNKILNYRKSKFIIVDVDAETCGGAKHVSNKEYRNAVKRIEAFFQCSQNDNS